MHFGVLGLRQSGPGGADAADAALPRRARTQGPKGELSCTFDACMQIETVRAAARRPKARWSHARKRSLTRPARRTPQEEDGSLRFRRKNDTKRAFQLHGLSRCAPRRAGPR